MRKNNDPDLFIENNTIFLTLDLKGMNLYQRGKAIRKFINSDTKVVEDYCDTLIRAIFKRNGINIHSNDKQAYKEAFDTLNGKGKRIEIIDFYRNAEFDDCEYLTTNDGQMTVLLESGRYLQTAIEIREVDI